MNSRLLSPWGGLFLGVIFFHGAASLTTIAQPLPHFEEIRPLTNKEVVLRLAATNGPLFRLETSTNSSGWSSLVTMPGASSLLHTDGAAPYLLHRLYRALQLTETNVLAGDHLVTTNGDVTFRPVNHASFVMSWNGKMIYNDPVGAASLYSTFPKADLILVSHEHGDHFNATTLGAVRAPNGIIVAPQAVYNQSSMAALRSSTMVLTNGGIIDLLGLQIQAIPATNSNHQPGVGNGYVVTIGGKRIYMSGDTGDIPPVRMLTNIDVAFVAMNLPFTMSVANAASAVREFRPKVVYPYHYSSSTPVADLNDFKRRIGQDLGIEVRLRKWY